MQILHAEAGDVDRIMEIMMEAFREIRETDWYVTEKREYVVRHLEEQGFLLKAEEHGVILAFLLVHIPGREEEGHLGEYLNLGEEERGKMAYMDSVSVCSATRGKGLMGKLMAEAQRELYARGFCYLMGTVHPDNCFSLGNFIRQGYKVAARAKKYGGLSRLVMYKLL